MTPRSDRGPENDAWARSSRKRGARRSHESTSSWKQSMTEKAVPPASATSFVGAGSERLGEEFPDDHPDHRAGGEPEPDREDRARSLDEEERRNRQ